MLNVNSSDKKELQNARRDSQIERFTTQNMLQYLNEFDVERASAEKKVEKYLKEIQTN